VEYDPELISYRSPFSSRTATASLQLQKLNQGPSSALPNGGKLIVDLGSETDDAARSVVLQSDGKILIAGYTEAQPSSTGGQYNYGVLRLNADGSFDTGFGNAGKALIDLGKNSYDLAYSMLTQTEGKILIAGLTQVNYRLDYPARSAQAALGP
jgi:uncharacterized delta-60 repeat protein